MIGAGVAPASASISLSILDSRGLLPRNARLNDTAIIAGQRGGYPGDAVL
jgi:hypothetical protein